MPSGSLFDTGLFFNSEHAGKYVEVGNGRLHYLEKGEGDPLVLLHGLGQSLYTWNRVFEGFAAQYRTIALDLPALGYSTWEGGLSVGEIIEVLRAFLEALGIESAHFAGFAAGAVYALAFAEEFPGKSRRIIAITPGGITSGMPRAVKSFASQLTGWFTAAKLSPKTVEQVLLDAYFDKTLVTRRVVEEYYRPLSSREAVTALKDAVLAFEDGPTIDALPKVESEVLLVWGSDDRWHDCAMAEDYAELPQVKRCFLRNCGHIVPEEKPERFLEFSLRFLQNGLGEF